MGKIFDALQKVQSERYTEKDDLKLHPSDRDSVLDDKLISFFQPSSIVSEQFRRLRVHTIRSDNGHSPRTILISSALSGEGKSFVAANLAATIATEFNHHALLVDCDLRNPTLSHMFGLSDKKGLSDYLSGIEELSELFIKTPVEKLTILCSGTPQDNPSEMLGSKKMEGLVQELATRYADRFIIFDSSPVLATTEPSVLNKMVDGIVMVVKAGQTPRDSVLRAMKLLQGEKILGFVLNDLQFKHKALYEKYFGMNHYYYSYADKPEQPKTFLQKLSTLRRNFVKYGITGKNKNKMD
jgi:protein-tyrosine kinase